MSLIRAHWARLAPGLVICLIVAAAARFLSEHYGAPQMLFALLLGMALHFLTEDPRCTPGIDLAARVALRVGVALLGARITFDQVSGLGLFAVLWIAAGVVLTILVGLLAGRFGPMGTRFGLLSGGAVAICGASAAMAIAAVLPRDETSERNTILVVVSVTALSTLAMVLYPMAVALFDLTHHETGLFLGATIHDVAQVVGAGYSVSPETGDTATIAKLFRVALLMPVVLAIGLAFRGGRGAGAAPLPLFVLGFAALVVVNSLGFVPAPVAAGLSTVSGWCLVTAIAALGIKTSLKALTEVGAAPLVMMLGETLVLALWVGLGLWLGI